MKKKTCGDHTYSERHCAGRKHYRCKGLADLSWQSLLARHGNKAGVANGYGRDRHSKRVLPKRKDEQQRPSDDEAPASTPAARHRHVRSPALMGTAPLSRYDEDERLISTLKHCSG